MAKRKLFSLKAYEIMIFLLIKFVDCLIFEAVLEINLKKKDDENF